MPLSAWSWALYEGGRDPYLILVSVYVFMPYFVTRVIGDPVAGQAMVASYSKMAGLTVAFAAPLLGAVIDVTGRRKPWLLSVTAVAAPLIALLWWVTPGSETFTPAVALIIVTAISICYSLTEVLHNSLLQSAAGLRFAGRASGWALSLGAMIGLTTLLTVLIAFALPGQSTLPFVPDRPLFGLDQAAFEPQRIVAPIAAALLVAGAIPLALFVREGEHTGIRLGAALRIGLGGIGDLLRQVRGDKNVSVFLVSRLLYADGTAAVVLFLGIFAAGVMGWGVTQMLAFGISQSVCSALGGQLGGFLDDRLGPKHAAQIAIVGMIASMVALMGMAPDRILFLIHFDGAPPRLWDGPAFTTAPELVFLVCGAGVAFFGTASTASSRTLLAHLAPPGRSGAYFGLYSLAGRATVWLGPLLVELFTRTFKSQQAGFAPIAALMLAGLIGLLFVRPPTPEMDR